jgi:fructan beta-fructosidase
VELFADEGLTVMTSLFFPNKPITKLRIVGDKKLEFQEIGISAFKR